MPPRFGQGSHAHRSSVVLAVLLVVSLACVTLYMREGSEGSIHAVQNTISGFISPLKAVGGSISAGEERIANRISDATADPSSIVSLREQNEQLRSTIAQLEEYRQEALRLEGLLEIKNSYGAVGIPARVLSRQTDAWNRVITIDAGSAEGVRAGLPVMGPSGLIGQVVATTETTADIRLLQDSLSGVAVIIQSSREEGIVQGSLEGVLYLQDIGDEVEVEPGDVVLTSGLGGGYFRGIMVGTILKVEGEAGATTRKIIVEPNEWAAPLEEVYVVTSMTSPYKIDEDDNSSENTSSQVLVDTDGDGIGDTYMDAATAAAYGYTSLGYADAYGVYDTTAYGYGQG